jgi:hypothetical protein
MPWTKKTRVREPGGEAVSCSNLICATASPSHGCLPSHAVPANKISSLIEGIPVLEEKQSRTQEVRL